MAADRVEAFAVDVFLSISVTGLLLAPCTDPDLKPAEFDPADERIINFHAMRVISMAAVGGRKARAARRVDLTPLLFRLSPF